MTDYFALLEQPRQPWLDPAALKQAFHAKALKMHPDTQEGIGEDSAADFAELNEAHQVLQDPKRRLEHLLSLSGRSLERRSSTIPKEIEELFPMVAALTQRVIAALEQSGRTTTSLARSLMKPELVKLARQLELMLEQLSGLLDTTTARLQMLNERWHEGDDEQLNELQQLHLRFSYLNRWKSELNDKQQQLASI